MLAARADDRLVCLVVEAIFALELFDNCLAQRRDPRNRGVFRLAAIDRIDSGFLDIVGRIEIRLPDRQADNVATLRLEFTRFLRHGNRGRGLHTGQCISEKGHNGSPE